MGNNDWKERVVEEWKRNDGMKREMLEGKEEWKEE